MHLDQYVWPTFPENREILQEGSETSNAKPNLVFWHCFMSELAEYKSFDSWLKKPLIPKKHWWVSAPKNKCFLKTLLCQLILSLLKCHKTAQFQWGLICCWKQAGFYLNSKLASSSPFSRSKIASRDWFEIIQSAKITLDLGRPKDFWKSAVNKIKSHFHFVYLLEDQAISSLLGSCVFWLDNQDFSSRVLKYGLGFYWKVKHRASLELIHPCKALEIWFSYGWFWLLRQRNERALLLWRCLTLLIQNEILI